MASTFSPTSDVLFSCPACQAEMCVGAEYVGVSGPCIGCGEIVCAQDALVAAAQEKLFSLTPDPVEPAPEEAQLSSSYMASADQRGYDRVFIGEGGSHEGAEAHTTWIEPSEPNRGIEVDGTQRELNSSAAMLRAQQALFGVTEEESHELVEPARKVTPLAMPLPQPEITLLPDEPSTEQSRSFEQQGASDLGVCDHQTGFETEAATNVDGKAEETGSSPFIPEQEVANGRSMTPGPGEYDAIETNFIRKNSDAQSHLPPPRRPGQTPRVSEPPEGFVPNRVIAPSNAPRDDSWRDTHRRRRRSRRRVRKVEDGLGRITDSTGFRVARAGIVVGALSCVVGFLWWMKANDWGNKRHLESIQVQSRSPAEINEPEGPLASQWENERDSDSLPEGGIDLLSTPDLEEHETLDLSRELEMVP